MTQVDAPCICQQMKSSQEVTNAAVLNVHEVAIALQCNCTLNQKYSETYLTNVESIDVSLKFIY